MTIHNPNHPGEHIRDILIDGAELSITEAASHLGVTRTTLSRLIHGHTGISPEMALRLSKLLNTSVEFWVNLQSQYDVWTVNKFSAQINIKPLKSSGLLGGAD